MKQLIEFIPLVLFFIFFKLYNIYTAVAILMIASTIALILIYFIYRSVDKISLFSYGMVIFFGTLTLYFKNPLFIQWKVSIIYFVLAAIFLFSQLCLKKNLIKNLLGKEIELAPNIWGRLNIGWSLFFILCALLNLYVMLTMSNDAWVDFKSFWLTGLSLLFTLLSGLYIYKHVSKSDDSNNNLAP